MWNRGTRTKWPKLPPAVRNFMSDRSARIWIYEGGNKPPNMPGEAPGMNPTLIRHIMTRVNRFLFMCSIDRRIQGV